MDIGKNNMADRASKSVDIVDSKLAKCFVFCLYAYALVTVSCAFPPGFISVFSILTFLLSLMIIVSQRLTINLLSFEKAGIILIIGMAFISISKSRDIGQLLIELFEYRLYFFTPFIAVAFAKITTRWRDLLRIIWLSGNTAVVASYLIYFDLFFVEVEAFSLANRIYHGFVLGMTGAVNIYFIRKSHSSWKIFIEYFLLFLLIFNLFFIENGRTGFIIGSVLCLFAIVSLKRRIGGICFVSIFILVAVIFPNSFKDRVLQTFNAVEESMVKQDYQSSVGHRWVFYQRAFDLIKNAPTFGVGLIDAEPALKGSKLFPKIIATDNVHSEFLNVTIIGGMVSLFIFLLYFYSIGSLGYRHMSVNGSEGWLIFYIMSVFFIQSLFNSTVKDFGDKNLVILMLVLTSSIIRSKSLGNRRDC